jgi:archaellum component FlaF (FlaF/FlaG flagellin family)
MALEKTETLRHDIESNGTVFVETVTTVTDDGAVVGSNNHRKPILPGDDYSAEAEVTRNICAAVQTDAVVAAYQAAQAAAAAESSEE